MLPEAEAIQLSSLAVRHAPLHGANPPLTSNLRITARAATTAAIHIAQIAIVVIVAHLHTIIADLNRIMPHQPPQNREKNELVEMSRNHSLPNQTVEELQVG